MTFKERLQKEYPDCVDNRYQGGCNLCPDHYGYESDEDSVRNCRYGCDYCWNREIPEEKNGEHMKRNTFRKSDLKDGMVIEYRSGKKAVFIGDLFMVMNESDDLDSFSDNLLSPEHNDKIDYDFDIMKVYRINRHKKYPGLNDILNDKTNTYLDLIWERKEAKEPTNNDKTYEEKLTYEELYEKLDEFCNSLDDCTGCPISNTGCYCKNTSKKELKRLWNIVQEYQSIVTDNWVDSDDDEF